MNSVWRHVQRVGASRRWLYLVAVAVPLALTIIGSRVGFAAFVFEHLIVVLVVVLAIAGGRGPAIVTAVVAGIGDNLLLREPIGRPAITGARDVVDLGLFLGVAIVVGWLVDRLRRARADALKAADSERLAREDLDRLVATVTHDLATPLNAIRGTIQFARKHETLSEVDLARLLARVETAAARASSLLRTLADSKSIEHATFALEFHSIDFRTVVEPIAKMLDRTSDRHPIALAIDTTPLILDGDAERLGRVVENLISNAIKYSPHGGVVEVSAYHEDGWVTLSVRDQGIGLPPDHSRLFELGYRAPEAAKVAPGLGLGLYTAAEVVKRHGGTIEAARAESGGTVFTVRLPCLIREAEHEHTSFAQQTVH
jgi:signal transduction histidine kinase